jgi:hypothetical protein
MIPLRDKIGPPLRRLTGRTRYWSADQQIGSAFPGAGPATDGRALVAAVNRAHDSGIEPEFALTGRSPASSAVPYVPGGTELVVHNFFAHNYAIRDAILFRVALASDGRAVATRQFTLGSNETRHLDVDSFLRLGDTGPEHGIVIVSAHHPRIHTPANQLRYIVLYRSRSGLAGVHSLATANGEVPRSALGYRAIAPRRAEEEHRFATIGAMGNVVRLEPGDPLPSFPANGTAGTMARGKMPTPFYSTTSYLLVLDGDGACTAVWHDGNVSHRVAGHRDDGTARAVFGLPPAATSFPIVAIDADQVGQIVRSGTVTLFDRSGHELARASLDHAPEQPFTLDLGRLFPSTTPPALGYVTCDFGFDARPKPKAAEVMLHVYRLDNDQLYDQMHTIRTRALAIGDGPGASATRARKFCPLLVGGERRTAFTIVNLGPWGDLPETTCTLRIFSDVDGELLRRVSLPANGVRSFDAAEFLPHDGRSRVGALWIEHPTVNLFAHWWVSEDGKPGAACDHFTGG